MKAAGGQFNTLGKCYNVYVRFLSVPGDIKCIRICEGMDIETLKGLIKDTFTPYYTNIPERIFLYCRQKLRYFFAEVEISHMEQLYEDALINIYTYSSTESIPIEMPQGVKRDVEYTTLGVFTESGMTDTQNCK